MSIIKVIKGGPHVSFFLFLVHFFCPTLIYCTSETLFQSIHSFFGFKFIYKPNYLFTSLFYSNRAKSCGDLKNNQLINFLRNFKNKRILKKSSPNFRKKLGNQEILGKGFKLFRIKDVRHPSKSTIVSPD